MLSFFHEKGDEPMFSSAVSCIVSPVTKENVGKVQQGCIRPSYKIAVGVDLVLGVALLVIGICATQWGFLPVGLQYALIGAGSTYLMFMFLRIGSIIKVLKAPESFLVK